MTPLEQHRPALATVVHIHGGDVDTTVPRIDRETLARVHHEIRTPLAAILAHLELLDEETELALPMAAEIALAAIRRSGARLSAVMAELDNAVGIRPGDLAAGLTR